MYVHVHYSLWSTRFLQLAGKPSRSKIHVNTRQTENIYRPDIPPSV